MLLLLLSNPSTDTAPITATFTECYNGFMTVQACVNGDVAIQDTTNGQISNVTEANGYL